MNVFLYSIKKRENSTKRPDVAGVLLQCTIKTESSIENPTLELNLGLQYAPNYNYAYIPDFNRYYFIENRTYSPPKWTFSLSVDVLATYKADIGAANLYVLRAAAEKDGNVVDTLYPAKTNCTYVSTPNTEQLRYWETNVNNGSFVLGVVSKDPYYGSLDYYVCDVAALKAIVYALMADIVTAARDFDVDDASLALQLNLVDPLQYIKSCIYIPVAYSDLPGTPLVDPLNPGDISIFNYDINITAGNVKELRSIPQYVATRNYILPQHPQAATRGNYLNTAPFTRHSLIVPPFGMIELDTTITCNAASVGAEAIVDLPTGKGFLVVTANGHTISRTETQVGVPVQLSQVSRDYLGAAMGATNGIAGAIGSALSGNISGAIMSATNGIESATRAMMPRSSSIGSGGSYGQFYSVSELESQFFPIVDDDNTQNGRPLCKIRQPANLGGYMLIQDADIPINGSAEESRKLRAYLENGFYYE